MTERGTAHESSLLLTLEEISQLVSHSHDPGETLANIVRLIQGRFHTDVCSVYLLEPELGELVLGATIGLKPESVGRVRMRLDEGLTGLVAEQMAPVMVEDAFGHPRFKYFPEAGEDPYHSFLGVPLVEGGICEGVLVVQTTDPRRFSENEIRMLVTVASQLAPLVSEAQLLERVVAAAHAPPAPVVQATHTPGREPLRGVALSSGVGVGEVYVVDGFEEWLRSVATETGDSAVETERLQAAMGRARGEIGRLSHHISALVGQDHGAVLQAQLMILQDRKIERDLTDCLAAGASAETALEQTLDKYVAVFQKLTSSFFQDRVYDVKDVFRRILWHLRPHPPAPGATAERLVLVAREVSVMDLFSVDLDRLAGVIVEHGGPQSHAAILARSLNVPMVGQVRELVSRVAPGQQVLVDGDVGVVYVEPAPDLIAAATARAAPAAGSAAVAAAGQGSEAATSLTSQPPPTALITPLPLGERGTGEGPIVGVAAPVTPALADGLPRIEANINLLCEVPQSIQQGAIGVGLYRTEFLFLARRTLPTEEEQVGTYRKLLTMLGGRPASIRTFDLRPDKIAHHAHLTSAAAGPLDWRLVLDSPPLQKLFRDQVRAILRAATIGPARILVPLVTRSEQLDFIIQTVGRARDELQREGLEFGHDVPLGIMVEVTAAARMIEPWAKHADFFALGTNDLVASALGIDRDDPAVASLNDPLHPGLLGTIHDVVRAAHAAGRSVTVCGEMASDPEGVLALAALEADSLSVAVRQLGAVRRVLARHSPDPLRRLAPQLVSQRTADQARVLLRTMGIAIPDDRGMVNC